jgi:hypothetical protein
MEGRNQPVARACLCCHAATKLMPKLGNYDEYRCPTCGIYRVPDTTQQLIDNGADPTRGRFVFRDGLRFLEV